MTNVEFITRIIIVEQINQMTPNRTKQKKERERERSDGNGVSGRDHQMNCVSDKWFHYICFFILKKLDKGERELSLYLWLVLFEEEEIHRKKKRRIKCDDND